MSVDPRVWGVDLAVSLANLDLQRSPQAGLAAVSAEENVARTILRLLDTPLGDLPAHPTWGNGAWDILSEPMTASWVDRLLAATRTALALEPRIRLLGLSCVLDQPNRQVRVGVSYELLSQPGERNLVWTVNLDAVRGSMAP